MQEWHDLAPVYDILTDKPAPAATAPVETKLESIAQQETEEEHLLAMLLGLESKLEGDLARKPKHQKPELQRQWQHEIVQLSRQLGLV
ncbi:hypothetical protein YEEN111655_09110 [Yersinia entomophaga]